MQGMSYSETSEYDTASGIMQDSPHIIHQNV